MLFENFKEKKIKIPFVGTCPKLLCCQKRQFGPLGVTDPLPSENNFDGPI